MAVSMMKEWQGKIINVESIVMDEDTTPLAEANRKWRLVWKRKVMPIIQRNISPIFCMLFKKQKIQTTRVQKQYHILKSVSTTSLPWTEKILQIKKKTWNLWHRIFMVIIVIVEKIVRVYEILTLIFQRIFRTANTSVTADQAEKLANLGSSQANESFNNTVAA